MTKLRRLVEVIRSNPASNAFLRMTEITGQLSRTLAHDPGQSLQAIEPKVKSKFWGEPHHFLQVFILRNFKSNGFASAYSKGLAEAFFASACSKGFASVGQRPGVTI